MLEIAASTDRERAAGNISCNRLAYCFGSSQQSISLTCNGGGNQTEANPECSVLAFGELVCSATVVTGIRATIARPLKCVTMFDGGKTCCIALEQWTISSCVMRMVPLNTEPCARLERLWCRPVLSNWIVPFVEAISASSHKARTSFFPDPLRSTWRSEYREFWLGKHRPVWCPHLRRSEPIQK
jgi:hypothetical protein